MSEKSDDPPVNTVTSTIPAPASIDERVASIRLSSTSSAPIPQSDASIKPSTTSSSKPPASKTYLSSGSTPSETLPPPPPPPPPSRPSLSIEPPSPPSPPLPIVPLSHIPAPIQTSPPSHPMHRNRTASNIESLEYILRPSATTIPPTQFLPPSPHQSQFFDMNELSTYITALENHSANLSKLLIDVDIDVDLIPIAPQCPPSLKSQQDILQLPIPTAPARSSSVPPITPRSRDRLSSITQNYNYNFKTNSNSNLNDDKRSRPPTPTFPPTSPTPRSKGRPMSISYKDIRSSKALELLEFGVDLLNLPKMSDDDDNDTDSIEKEDNSDDDNKTNAEENEDKVRNEIETDSAVTKTPPQPKRQLGALNNSSSSKSIKSDSSPYTSPSSSFRITPKQRSMTKLVSRQNPPLSYKDFLLRLMMPEASDVVDFVRRFVGSVLGPNGDGSMPGSTPSSATTSSRLVTRKALASLDYEFFGSKQILTRLPSFFYHMEDLLLQHPTFGLSPTIGVPSTHHSGGLGDLSFKSVVDGLEKYVMSKVHKLAFNATVNSVDDYEYYFKCKLLNSDTKQKGFNEYMLTPEMLEIQDKLICNKVVLEVAASELRKMSEVKSPGDKMECIYRSCNIIFSAFNLRRTAKIVEGKNSNVVNDNMGADDFLPVYIIVVLRANVPMLISNCQYIERFRNREDFMGRYGWCYANMRSAVEFLVGLDSDVLKFEGAAVVAAAAVDSEKSKGKGKYKSKDTKVSIVSRALGNSGEGERGFRGTKGEWAAEIEWRTQVLEKEEKEKR